MADALLLVYSTIFDTHGGYLILFYVNLSLLRYYSSKSRAMVNLRWILSGTKICFWRLSLLKICPFAITSIFEWLRIVSLPFFAPLELSKFYLLSYVT